MATRTVQPKQTVAGIAQTNNISEDQFYLANPGVKTLRPGQVVNVPKPFQFTAQPQTANPFAGTGVATGGTNTTGNSFFNSPANSNGAVFSYAPTGYNSYGTLNTLPKPLSNATNPFSGAGVGTGGTNTTGMSFGTAPKPITGNVFSYAPTGYNSYGTLPLTPSQSQNIPPSAGNVNLTPSQSQNIPTAQTTVSSTPTRPAGTYTGDPNDPNTAAWKAYWNYSAQNPSQTQTQSEAPRVMSRSEIWNMKAESRRKKMAKSAGDNQTGNSPVMPTAQPELVRSIVWGI